MRILFANHTGSVSGAEHALLQLVGSLSGAHHVVVACPNGGPLAAKLDRAGVRRTPIPAFEASFRPHPIHTPEGMARLFAGGIVLARAAHRLRADVLYANTARAALLGVLARRLGGPPLVVRVHDHLPSTPLGQAVRSVIARNATAVLAVSQYTADRFNDGLTRPIATRVYNGIDHARFDPTRVPRSRLREELGIGADAILLGQVAQLTPWKRQDHSIRTLAELRRGGLDAHLVLVGKIMFPGRRVRYDNHAYLSDLHRLVDDLEVSDAVHFIGHSEDVPALLRGFDLSLMPSVEEPFALAVVESMAMGTPPVVSSDGGPAELVEDGLAGFRLPAALPGLWAKAVRGAIGDRHALERMSTRGREVAGRFRSETHAHEIAAQLEHAASDPPRRQRGRSRSTAKSRHAPEGSQWSN